MCAGFIFCLTVKYNKIMSPLEISLIPTCFSFCLFVVYNATAIGVLGIPWSMSRTYYLYEAKKKGLGWVFTAFMWIMAFTLLPGFLEVSETMGSWMKYFTFLAFVTAASIAFVGTAPRYYDDLEGKVHMIAAKICAASALLWDFLVCWNIWYVPIAAAIIPIIVGVATKTWKECRDYWLEMIAFDATFATIITETILQIWNQSH